jgi:hypothetical protein
MQSFKFAERNIFCGEASQWQELLKASEGGGPATVIDLRTFLEIGDQPLPEPPEGWGYRRLPLTGATVSEQDLDVFRREFYRKPQTVVLGPNRSRAELLVAASVARHERGGFQAGQRAEQAGAEEKALLHWLTAYLVRHDCEEAQALEALGEPPARPAKVPSAPLASASPFEAVEATVEMPAVSAMEEPTVEMPAVAALQESPPVPSSPGSEEPAEPVSAPVETEEIASKLTKPRAATKAKTKGQAGSSKGKTKRKK